PMLRTSPMTLAVSPRSSRWRPTSTAAMPNPNARSKRAARISAKSREIGGRPAFLHAPTPPALGLTPGIERVVHRALEPDLLLVGQAMDQREAAGDRAQPGRLRRNPDVL